jgi:hypothetical protein
MSQPAPPIVLHLGLHVAGHRHDDFLAFLRRARVFYEAPGGIEVSLLQSLTDRDAFIEAIRYRNRVDYDVDAERLRRDESMRAYIDEWHGLLLQPPAVQVFEDVSHAIRPGDLP